MFANEAPGTGSSRRDHQHGGGRPGRRTKVAACVGAALIAVGIGAYSAAASPGTHTHQSPNASRKANATVNSSTASGRTTTGRPAPTPTTAPAAPAAPAPSAVPAAPDAPAAPAAPGLGSADLVQSEDFFQQGLGPVGATVGLAGKQALSACSGEETMRTLTKGAATAYAELTWSFDTKDSLLTESLAEGPTAAAATSYEKRLDQMVRGCQDEPKGHWYYGTGHAFTVQGGGGTWYPAFSGDGTVSGGVAVIRSGREAGIVELTGQPSDDPGYMAGIATAAAHRLAG